MGLKSAVATAYLAVSRWKLVCEPLPPKVVIIGAPHTSNWDGVFMAVSLWKGGRPLPLLWWARSRSASAPRSPSPCA